MRRSWLALVLIAAVTAIPVAATAADGAKVGKIVDDRAMVRVGKWTSKASATAWQKTLSKSKVKGARLSTKESTASGGAVSFQAGPGRGKALIKVGGVKKTVNTAAKKKKTKVVHFSGSGKVVVKVKAPGTKGVYVDVVLLNDVGTPPSTTPYPGAGEVIFTEWLSQPDLVPQPTGEWFELQNLTDDTLRLTGCTVTDGEGTSTLTSSNMNGANVFVFARSTNPDDNGGLVVDGAFGLDLETDDTLTLTCGGTTIDTVSWIGEIEGQTRSLDPDHYSATQNDVDANYCPGAIPYGPGDDLGTPMEFNTQCP